MRRFPNLSIAPLSPLCSPPSLSIASAFFLSISATWSGTRSLFAMCREMSAPLPHAVTAAAGSFYFESDSPAPHQAPPAPAAELQK
eukprot:gene4642-biopygen14555